MTYVLPLASGLPVAIESSKVLTNAALYTSPTWTAGAYRRVYGVLKLTSWTHAVLRFAGGFGANTGRTAGTRIAATALSITTDMYLNYGASSPSIGIITFEMFPLKDTAPRGGTSRSSAVDVATGAVTDACNLNFHNTDLTTEVTGILIDFLTTNATGTISLYGEPR